MEDEDEDFRELVELHKKNAELIVLLRRAYYELIEHDAEYHHRTPVALLDEIKKMAQL